MIDEKKLIEELKVHFDALYREDGMLQHSDHVCTAEDVDDLIALVNRQPKVGEWIPCSERLPKEHDSFLVKYKGTDKWRNGMFETISDNVNVTIEFEDGTRITITSHTVQGNWRCEKDYGLKNKVIAWQPLPEPYKEKK